MRYYRRDCVPEWRDFWKFAADVNLPDKDGSRFRRVDQSAPHGPGNWFWFAVSRTDGDPQRRKEIRREYQRRLRQANRDYFLERDLKKHYGVTLAWYRDQLERQGGACAICRQPETLVIRGKVMRLAVDHCKDTGRVRGLLCSKCNQGIGCFVHDGAHLLAAVDYLRGT